MLVCPVDAHVLQLQALMAQQSSGIGVYKVTPCHRLSHLVKSHSCHQKLACGNGVPTLAHVRMMRPAACHPHSAASLRRHRQLLLLLLMGCL